MTEALFTAGTGTGSRRLLVVAFRHRYDFSGKIRAIFSLGCQRMSRKSIYLLANYGRLRCFQPCTLASATKSELWRHSSLLYRLLRSSGLSVVCPCGGPVSLHSLPSALAQLRRYPWRKGIANPADLISAVAGNLFRSLKNARAPSDWCAKQVAAIVVRRLHRGFAVA